MTQIQLAESIAREAHKGQFRRDGITPAITHPEAVAGVLQDEYEVATAWLHDTLEDTKLKESDLLILWKIQNLKNLIF